MRNAVLLLGVAQLLTALAWGGSWLAERRQHPTPQHLGDQPAAPPGRKRQRAFMALASLALAIYFLARAWALS
jgi:hypothetical protein